MSAGRSIAVYSSGKVLSVDYIIKNAETWEDYLFFTLGAVEENNVTTVSKVYRGDGIEIKSLDDVEEAVAVAAKSGQILDIYLLLQDQSQGYNNDSKLIVSRSGQISKEQFVPFGSRSIEEFRVICSLLLGVQVTTISKLSDKIRNNIESMSQIQPGDDVYVFLSEYSQSSPSTPTALVFLDNSAHSSYSDDNHNTLDIIAKQFSPKLSDQEQLPSICMVAEDIANIDYITVNIDPNPNYDRMIESDQQKHVSNDPVPVKRSIPIEFHLDGFQLSWRFESFEYVVGAANIDYLKICARNAVSLPRSCNISLFSGEFYSGNSTQLTSDSLESLLDTVAATEDRIGVHICIFPTEAFVVQLVTGSSIKILVEVDPLLSWDSFCDYISRLGDVEDRTPDPTKTPTVRVYEHDTLTEYKNTKSFRNGDRVSVVMALQETSQVLGRSDQPSPLGDMDAMVAEAIPIISDAILASDTLQSSSKSSSFSSVRIEECSDESLSFEDEIARAMRAMGIELKPHVISSLRARSSSVDGAIDYYLSNMSLYGEEAQQSTSSSSKMETHEEELASPLPHALKNVKPHQRNLVNELWSMNIDENIILEAIKRSNTVEGASAYIFNTSNPAAEAKFECPICYDEVQIGDMYTSNCNKNHRVCMTCTARYTKLALLGDEENSVHLPACPLAAVGGNADSCNHLMEEQEVLAFLRIAEEKKILTANEKRMMEKTLKRLYYAKVRRENNFIRCVGCDGKSPEDDVDDGTWFSVEGLIDGERMPVTCPRCSSTFCSRCRSLPYHYSCSCDEIVNYARAWREWEATGKEKYMRQVSNQNQQYQRMLQEYDGKKRERQVIFFDCCRLNV